MLASETLLAANPKTAIELRHFETGDFTLTGAQRIHVRPTNQPISNQNAIRVKPDRKYIAPPSHSNLFFHNISSTTE